MNNNQRKRGSEIEYLVCKCLAKMGYKPQRDGYTAKRISAIKCAANARLETKICQALVCILGPAKEKEKKKSKTALFSLMRDTHGSSTSATRSTSDVVIHSEPPINISIKHNNQSLKHQKASNLWSQMRMCPSRKRRFIEAYEKITSAWYAAHCAPGPGPGTSASTYSEVSQVAKQTLYNDINSLILKNLVSAPQKDLRGYLDFILDLPTANKYIIKCDKDRAAVRVMQLCVPGNAPITGIKRVGNFIEIQLGGPDLVVRMRLHTCKNRLTPKLALKYDTQLKGGLVDVVSF